MKTLKKILSGGQTGVDQAALQAAIDMGLEHGGWCPPGRMCETGIIPDHFNLKETPEERDLSALEIPRSQRTIWNVRDADGLLILKGLKAQRDQGTELSLEKAKEFRRPYLSIISEMSNIKQIRNWIEENQIEILNVAGWSEVNSPGIYNSVYEILINVLRKTN